MFKMGKLLTTLCVLCFAVGVYAQDTATVTLKTSTGSSNNSTVSIDGGAASNDSVNASVTKYASVAIDAVAEAGFTFQGWIVSGGVAQIGNWTSASTTVETSADVTITALFTSDSKTQKDLTLAISPESSGRVTLNGTSYTDASSTITLNTNQWYTITSTGLDVTVDSTTTYYTFAGYTGLSNAYVQNIYAPNGTQTYILITDAATATSSFSAISTTSLIVKTDQDTDTTTYITSVENLDRDGTTYTVAKNTRLTVIAPTTITKGTDTYKFSHWSLGSNIIVDGGPSYNESIYESSILVYVSDSSSMTAVYTKVTEETATLTLKQTSPSAALNSYDIDGTNHASGTITTDGLAVTVPKNQWIEANCWVDTANFSFSKWVGGGSVTIYNVADNQTYIYVTGDDATLYATAAFKTTSTAKLTLSADPLMGLDPTTMGFDIGGSAVAPGQYVYETGQWYNLVVYPLSSEAYTYCLTSWETSGGVSIIYDTASTPNTWKFYLTGDASITAKLTKKDTVVLTSAVSPTNAGKMRNYTTADVYSYSNRKHFLAKNEWYLIEAVPHPGYKFVKWEGSEGVTVEDTTYFDTRVALAQDGSLTAVFEAHTWSTLTLSPSSVVAGCPEVTDCERSGIEYIDELETMAGIFKGVVPTGKLIKITANPSSGYKVTGFEASEGATLYKPIKDYQNEFIYAVLTGDATVTIKYEATGISTLTLAVSPEQGAQIYNSAPDGGMSWVGSHARTTGRYYQVSIWENDGYKLKQFTVTDNITIIEQNYGTDMSGHTAIYIWILLNGSGTVTAEMEALPTAALTCTSDPSTAIRGFYLSDDFNDPCATGNKYDCDYYKSYGPIYANKAYKLSYHINHGYKFVEWVITGDAKIVKKDYTECVSTSGSCSDTWYWELTLTGDATVTAKCEAIDPAKLTVVVDPENSGTVKIWDAYNNLYVGPTTVNYAYEGDIFSLYAFPEVTSGLQFYGYVVTSGDAVLTYDLDGEINVAKVTINSDTTVKAMFRSDPTYPILTITGDSTYTTTPGAGSYKMLSGVEYDVTATSTVNQTFLYWEVTEGEDNITFSDKASATAKVTLTGNATIKPVFGNLYEGNDSDNVPYLDVTSMSIKTQNDNDPEKPKDSVKISKASLNTDAIPDLSSGFILGIDGWEYTIDSGIEGQNVDFKSSDNTVTVKIDATKNTMDVSVRSVDIFDYIANNDGVDVYLIIGGTNIVKDNVTMDEKNSWAYKILDKEISKTTSVKKFSAKSSTKQGRSEDKDTIATSGQDLGDMPEGFDTSTVVTVLVSNDATFAFDPSDTDRVKVTQKNNKYSYKYTPTKEERTKSPESYSLTIDFDKGTWTFKASRSNDGVHLRTDGAIVVTIKMGTLGTVGFPLLVTDDSDLPQTEVIVKRTMSFKQK